jgi:hypothetical protein
MLARLPRRARARLGTLNRRRSVQQMNRKRQNSVPEISISGMDLASGKNKGWQDAIS